MPEIARCHAIPAPERPIESRRFAKAASEGNFFHAHLVPSFSQLLCRQFESAIPEIVGKGALLCGADLLNVSNRNAKTCGKNLEGKLRVAHVPVNFHAHQPPRPAGTRRYRLHTVVAQDQVDKIPDRLAKKSDLLMGGQVARPRQLNEIHAQQWHQAVLRESSPKWQ